MLVANVRRMYVLHLLIESELPYTWLPYTWLATTSVVQVEQLVACVFVCVSGE